MEPAAETPADEAPTVPHAPAALLDEVSAFLLWMSKRWPALGLGGLVVAVVLWVDFIRLFDLPVSFVSPGILSALPILGLAVGVPVAVAMVLAAAMAFVLWQPLHRGGPSLIEWAAEDDDEPTGKRPDPFSRWVLLGVAHAMYWIAYVTLVTLHVRLSGEMVWLFAVLVPGALGFGLFWPVFRAASPVRPSKTYLALFAMCMFMETLVAGSLFLPMVASASGGGLVGIISHMETYFLMMMGIALVQLVTARLVMRGWRRGLLRKVFLFVMGFLVAILAVPDIGGMFASYRLRLSGPDHATCMVLLFRQGAAVEDTLPGPVRAAPDAPRSRTLDFVTRLDDQYYVKEKAFSGPTYAVPVASVAGFEACPAPPHAPGK